MKIDTSQIESQFKPLDDLLTDIFKKNNLSTDAGYDKSMLDFENAISTLDYSTLVLYLGVIARTRFNSIVVNEFLKREDMLCMIHSLFANQSRGEK